MSSEEPDPLLLEVQRVRFTTVRMRQGYDLAAVDDFLDRAAHALQAGEPIGPMADGARFAPTRFGNGYDPQEVDEFLSYLVAEQSSRSEEPPPEPVAADRAAQGSEEPLPSVIEERRGLLSRLFGR